MMVAMTPGSKTLYLFPDTNLFIQGKPLEELDWSRLSDSDQYVVVVSKPVLREIDRQKGAGGRIGRRARRANTLLGKLVEDNVVHIQPKMAGAKVRVELGISIKPSAELEYDLDYTEADSQLVGIVHRFATDNPGLQVALLSGDNVVRAVATEHGLRCLRLPDEWLLHEPDEQEQKIRQLEALIAQYEHSQPKCGITVNGAPWRFQRVKYRAIEEAEISILMGLLSDMYPQVSDFGSREPSTRKRSLGYIGSVDESYLPATDTEISDYVDARYPEWLGLCEDYLRSLHEKLNSLGGNPRISLEIANMGGVPATSVLARFEMRSAQLRLLAPDEKKAKREGEKEPAAVRLPHPPTAPKGRWKRRDSIQSMIDVFGRSIRVSAVSAMPVEILAHTPVFAMPKDPNSFYFRGGRPRSPVAVIEASCQEWRHRDGEESFTFEICSPLVVGAEAGLFVASVHAANLREPTELTERIVVETIEVSAFEEGMRLLDIPTPNVTLRLSDLTELG